MSTEYRATDQHTEHTEHTDRGGSVPAETEAEQTRPLPRVEPHNPAAPGGIVPRRDEEAVFDAEVVEEPPGTAVARRPRRVIEATGRLIPRPEQRARAGQAGRAAGKAVVRHGGYVYAGAGVAVRRYRDAHGMARYERLMASAEAEGKHDVLTEWQGRAEQAKHARAARRAAWARAPRRVVEFVGYGFLALVVVLLAVGIVLAGATRDLSMVVAPFTTTLALVNALYTVLRWVFWPVVLLAPVAGVAWLWSRGRASAWRPPSWAAGPEERAETAQSFAVVDEDMLTRAMAHCGVTTLNRALKAREKLFFIVVPRQQGGGTYVQVRLPLGVMAADFLTVERVERLAGNLGRHKHEVYPQRQPDADARVLDLWIADQGTMDRPAPEWPLLHEGEFDVFRDRVPWGVTMRGEQVEQSMLARHGFVGATSKQGKTASLRVPALALALDPTVELRISDLKGDGDWSMFAPRARTLIEGSALEQTVATCEMLEDLVAVMQDRYERKRGAGIRGPITRELSRAPGSGFHPIFAFVDECQVLYQEEHPIGGSKADARAWRAAKRLHDQARAVNIHLWQATQRPDPTAIPTPVREGPHVRIALKVPNHEAAKMVLAEAADLGARPQDLRMGRDAGTFVATGEFDGIPEGQAFLIVKSHYVSTEAAYPVIDRAMQILSQHGRTVDQHAHEATEDAAPVDVLADIATVLGEQPRMRTQEVIQRLTEHHRAHYDGWTFGDLQTALPESAKPYKSHGVMVVSADRIHEAITDRDDNAGGEPAPQ